MQTGFSEFWLPALVRAAAVILIAAVAGAQFGERWGWLALALGFAILAFNQLRYLYQLAHWLRSPTDQNIPDGWGAWEIVFSELYRREKIERKSRSRLLSEIERFRIGAATLPDAMVTLNQFNEIEWANGTAKRLLNIDGEHDRGHIVTNLLRSPAFEEMLRTAAKQTAQEPNVEIDHPGGKPIRLMLVLLPFEDGHILLARDITIEQRTDRMRRDFVANVSHELKTPLAVIGGYVEHLSDNPAMPEATRAQLYQHINGQYGRMRRLTDDLLMLSRLESDDRGPRNDQVNVNKLLSGLLEQAKALSRDQHQISLESNASDITTIAGSLVEIESALGNLVTNAVRYTPKDGSIQIAWRDNTFSVRDSGVGISAEHIPRLTERFYRVDASRSRDNVIDGGGTGLGLAIVKHVLLRHEAKLEIQSKEGEGSTFSVRFPAQRIEEKGQKPEAK
jgi:two-component system, OmpR family, phosphate regulon sensor histidine kinase PhoR